MAKHPFNPTCECRPCCREHGRRLRQARAEHQRQFVAGELAAFNQRQRARRNAAERRESHAPGTLAWAEARGGLIGGYEED